MMTMRASFHAQRLIGDAGIGFRVSGFGSEDETSSVFIRHPIPDTRSLTAPADPASPDASTPPAASTGPAPARRSSGTGSPSPSPVSLRREESSAAPSVAR